MDIRLNNFLCQEKEQGGASLLGKKLKKKEVLETAAAIFRDYITEPLEGEDTDEEALAAHADLLEAVFETEIIAGDSLPEKNRSNQAFKKAVLVRLRSVMEAKLKDYGADGPEQGYIVAVIDIIDGLIGRLS